jgi:hypothetical protein
VCNASGINFISVVQKNGASMQFDQKDPFGYPLGTYLWVFGVALIGGAVKYLNHSSKFSFYILFRDLVTACFAGLLTFWLCEWTNINGPLSAVLISIAGLMGTRALREIENLYRLRMGLPPESDEEREHPQKVEIDLRVNGGVQQRQGRTEHEGD